ncbi:MAG: hypothetical protein RLZZ444_537 [Pseudomonadota bacterium]|jgi:hypothetical protein
MSQSDENKPDFRLVLFGFCFCLMAMFAVIAYPRGEFLLVMANPESDPATLVAIIGEAGGTLVSSTRFEWLAVAHSNESNFASRLIEGGAVLVLDHALAAGCTKGN